VGGLHPIVELEALAETAKATQLGAARRAAGDAVGAAEQVGVNRQPHREACLPPRAAPENGRLTCSQSDGKTAMCEPTDRGRMRVEVVARARVEA
jgi:hypothetical protein